MGYQDDYVMRTISDLVRAIARLVLGRAILIMTFPRMRTSIRTLTGI